MFSLDSATLGWSNGLIPRTRPAIAVAYSQARNCAPSGPLTARCGTMPPPGTVSGPSAPPVVTVSTSSSVAPGALGDSTTTGRMPRPFLPVDSAISCSAQSPRPVIPVPSSMSATLLRPSLTAAAPSATPKARLGLSLSSPSVANSASAWSISSATSTPASAVGTRPNAVSAEYRPPTSGSASTTAAFISRAVASSGEPGSVTITKCRPASASDSPASRNACQ